MGMQRPYFMSDEAWYGFNPDAEGDERRWVLTKEAPPEAVKSYEEFYGMIEGTLKHEVLRDHNLETPEEVIKFAQAKGYKGAYFLKTWRGYDAYEPYMDEDEVTYTGLPYVILVKDGVIRMSTDEEALASLEVYDYEEEDDEE